MERCLHHQHIAVGGIYDHTARCETQLGRYRAAAAALTRSVNICGHCFGFGSVEYAQELVKLAHLLAAVPQEAARARDTAKRAAQLLVLHYGDSCVAELAEMEQLLAGLRL